jgi:hypothetical protein
MEITKTHGINNEQIHLDCEDSLMLSAMWYEIVGRKACVATKWRMDGEVRWFFPSVGTFRKMLNDDVDTAVTKMVEG